MYISTKQKRAQKSKTHSVWSLKLSFKEEYFKLEYILT